MDHRVVVTAGHVDHGKSTVVRALTGMEPDRLAEEHRRGLSIELGFVWGSLTAHDGRARTIAFVDVPGHQRFLATMLAGAGPAPAAMLIVAATDGWSAQTTDHVTALALLGIPILATALTKIDLVDEPRQREVETDVRQRLAAMGVRDAPTVPVDAAHLVGIDRLAHCLVEQASALPDAPDYGRGRLWIDRVFTVAGAGTVVTGTLSDGVFTVGQKLRVLPQNTPAKIRNIESLGHPVDQVNPGQRAAINVAGTDHHQIRRGDVIAADVAWPQSETFDVQLTTTDPAELGRGAWHLHIGTTHLPCRVRMLGDTTARITVDRPLPVTTGDRFILRDTGRRMIVAGGTVVDPLPAARPRGPSEHAEYGRRLAAIPTDDRTRCAAALVALGGGVRRMHDVLAATGVVDDHLVVVGDLVMTRACYDTLVERVGLLGPGAHTREVVLDHLVSVQMPAADAESLLAHLERDGVLVRVTGGYALASAAGDVRDAKHAAIDQFLAELAAQRFAPEDLQALLTRHGLDHRDVAAMLQQHTIVRAGRVTFAATSVAEAVAILAERWPDGAAFTAAQAKEAWGTTRRFAIPLLEHLDRIGVTAFDGQHRVLRRTQV